METEELNYVVRWMVTDGLQEWYVYNLRDERMEGKPSTDHAMVIGFAEFLNTV